MRNQEKKDTPDNSEIIINFLKGFQMAEPKGLIETRNFFSEAFILHTTDEIFDETDYRQQWADHINYLNDLCFVIKNFDKKEIDRSIDQAVKILKKSRKEAKGE